MKYTSFNNKRNKDWKSVRNSINNKLIFCTKLIKLLNGPSSSLIRAVEQTYYRA